MTQAEHQRQPRSEILWFASLPSLWAVVAGWIGYTWAPAGDAWVPVMFSAISIVGWPLATATRFIRFTGWRARNSPWDGPKLLGFVVAQLVLYTTVAMMPSHAPLAYRLGTGAAVIPAATLIGGLCQSAASRRKRARPSPKES